MKNAGRLSEPVTIRTTTTTVDAYGQHVTDATTSTVFWAEVIPAGSASESVKAAQIYPERSVTFIVRHPNPTDSGGGYTFNESDVLIWHGNEHDIIGTAIIGRRDGLRIYCKLRGTSNV